MSKPSDNPAFQHWVCDHCTQTYDSPLALSFPPVHHCPNPNARKTRDFKLKASGVGDNRKGFAKLPTKAVTQ